MIILKGKIPHTTHIYTKHSQKKVRKERQQNKAKYTSIKQRKAKACTKLSENLYCFIRWRSPQANRRFWDSQYRKIILLQGLQGKQRLWRYRCVVAILLYNGRSRPSDKGEGAVIRPWDNGEGGSWSPPNFFSALWASVWSKNKGALP